MLLIRKNLNINKDKVDNGIYCHSVILMFIGLKKDTMTNDNK